MSVYKSGTGVSKTFAIPRLVIRRFTTQPKAPVFLSGADRMGGVDEGSHCFGYVLVKGNPFRGKFPSRGGFFRGECLLHDSSFHYVYKNKPAMRNSSAVYS